MVVGTLLFRSCAAEVRCLTLNVFGFFFFSDPSYVERAAFFVVLSHKQ